MEGEGAALRREPFDLSSVLREELTMITPRLAEKQLRIAEDIGRALMLASDEGAVRKLLAVFLDNAVKYAETGGRIKVALKQAKRQAIFIVGNSGPGIPTADMDKLFERFYRGDPARSSKIEGYGLGLSIAKSLTERLGGQITVSSEPDLWTEFTVKLPGLRDEA
jgi:signal transduction histidine kinase